MKFNKKHISLAAVTLLLPFAASAQQEATCFRTDCEKGMIETIAKIDKKTDKFNLYFNMHGDFQADWTKFDGAPNNFDGASFKMKQFRIEAKGNINDWLSYRYRQRVTKDAINGASDNIWKAIDIAGIGINLKKWSFFLGKQCAAYGGIEFDLNPIEIYQYSDMVDYMSNFLTGVNIAYNFTPRQQLQFQVLDALNESSFDKYGAYTPAKIPLVYTLNWNGNFGDVYKTRWSASLMNEAKDPITGKGNHMYYFALGNDFNITDKFGAYFDWMYSIENIDRKGIITDIVGMNYTPEGAQMNTKTCYNSLLLHLNYRIAPAWNIFAKLMYEMEGVYKAHESTDEAGNVYNIEKGNYRTAWGYIGGIEYYPLKDRNLHFYLCYVGRDYKYTDRAKAFGAQDFNTNRVSIGFIWQMPVF